MPFNGSGQWIAPSSPGAFNPALSGSSATPTAWNTLLADIALGLSTCITIDGQSTPTANIPMGGNKITDLDNGTAATDAVAYGQISGFVPAGFRSMLAGLNTSNNVGTPNTKIDVAAGSCADSTQVYVLTLIAGTIDCATVGANGLDAGSLGASTWYHTYAIGKTTGETALLASTSATTPTMPSGYTLKRRIGSFKTNGSSHIISFTQTGDLFQWATWTLDVNTTATSSGTYTLNVPLGIAVMWQGTGGLVGATDTGTVNVSLCTPGVTALTSVAALSVTNPSNVVFETDGGDFSILTNTAQAIGFLGAASGSATAAITLATRGWLDRRGKDA